MFDLRIALRRGAVAAALTTIISLGYVALVLGAVKLAATKAPSPPLIGLSVPVVVVLFAILHTRAQRMVEEIGGTLTLTSEPGRGTRVEVRLPRGEHSPLARGSAA